jgi:hypothetical protein
MKDHEKLKSYRYVFSRGQHGGGRRRADTPLGLSTRQQLPLPSDQPTTRAPATRAEAVPLLAGGTNI